MPAMVRWPGVVEPGSRSNDIISHKDWFPTITEALGDADLAEWMKTEIWFGEENTQVYLDGYSFFKRFRGETDQPPHKEFFYFSDSSNLMNLRYNEWKIVFAEQRYDGAAVWRYLLVELRFPKIFNIRSNPFELDTDVASSTWAWQIDPMFVMQPAMAYIGQKLATFEDFPPRQAPESWTMGDVMQTIIKMAGSSTLVPTTGRLA